MFRIKLLDRESKHTGLYRQYTATALNNAYDEVMSGNLSVYRAARTYSVPDTTLRDRVAGRISIDTVKSGPSPFFSNEEESVFGKHLEYMASLGYGYTRSEVIEIASQYAADIGKRQKGQPLSRQWYHSFMSRWPGLQLKTPRTLTILRAKSATVETDDKYFNELESVLKKYNLMDKPQCIYNVDEKGISPNHAPRKLVTGRGRRLQCVTSERSLSVTIIGAGNAMGVQIPPFIIFPGARMRSELLDGCTVGCDGDVSLSGWSNGELFNKYMREHFIKYAQGLTDDQKIIVIFDGHKSHVSLSLIDWAKSKNMILFFLPAHTSHLLQPLDLGCYGPVSTAFAKVAHTNTRQTKINVTRYTIGKLASAAYVSGVSPENLKSSFARAGIYPFNKGTIADLDLLPSTTIENQPSINVDTEIGTQVNQQPTVDQEVPTSNNTIVVPAVEVSNNSDVDDIVAVNECDENIVKVHECEKDGLSGLDTMRKFVGRMEDSVKGNVESKKKKRNVLSRVVAGKAITEDGVTCEIEKHIASQRSGGKKVSNGKRVSSDGKKASKRVKADSKKRDSCKKKEV